MHEALPVAPAFIPGLELARVFYLEAVRPLLDQEFPGLPHTAALIGPGSEVQGFDSQRSTDHDWGPRLQIFLSDAHAASADSVIEMLAARLPAEVRGYPTVFAASDAKGEQASHWVTVAGLRTWLIEKLGFDPAAGVDLLDWLAVPTQVLAEITGGAVFHDGLGEGAGTGVRDLMRLVLLVQRHYPPYSKWLGTAFARTPAAAELLPMLQAALSAPRWPDRESSLCEAYEAAARLHNELSLTPPLEPVVRPRFYERPYRVLEAGRFVSALRDQILNERIRRLPPIGAVDQFIDSTDALGDIALLRAAVATELLADIA